MNTFLRSGVVALLLTAGLAVPAKADDWGKIALISSTMGSTAGRLCAGAADTNRPTDFGCASYAPSLTTAGDVSVTGNLSASKFIGDGSALTGVAAASSDRIVSGSTSMLAVSASGFISVTQGGTNTAWFDPSRGLVALGVSTTGGISGSTGYFYGNVGIGTTSPTTQLHIRANNTNYNIFNVTSTAGNALAGLFNDSSQNAWLRLYNSSQVEQIRLRAGGDSYITGGNVGVGTANPTAALQVSGSFTVSTSTQTTTPSLYVATDGNVGIGTTAPVTNLFIQGATNPTLRVSAGGVTSAEYGLATTNGSLSNFATANDAVLRANGVSNNLLLSARTASGGILFGTGSGDTEKMRITSAGNVGIGTTAPGKTLDVSGSANISGTVKLAGLGTEACNPGAYGTMRYTNGNLELCSPGN